MPRGVYDRSHLKAKKQLATSAGFSPTVAKTVVAKNPQRSIAKPAPKKAAPTKAVRTVSTGVENVRRVSPEIENLHRHIGVLTQTRVALSSQQNSMHDLTIVQSIDAEIVQSIVSLRAWREEHFPIPKSQVSALGAGGGPNTEPEIGAQPVPAPVPLPAPVPQPTQQSQSPIVPPAPPLPFTPASVQEVMRGSTIS